MRFKKVKLTSIEPTTVLKELRQALQSSVVIHLECAQKVDNPLDYWRKIAEAIGELDIASEDSETGEVTDSFWMDVRFDPRYSHTFRHHNTAQPLHSDGAYNARFLDTALFYCERQASAGGATLFLDVKTLVDVLKKEKPAFYEELIKTTVHFSKPGQPGKHSPIITHDAEGPAVNWNYYRVTPEQSPEIQKLCETFHQYLQSRFVERNDVMPLRLEANDVVIFRDTRVLHGRHAYEAQVAGDRLIWKCYFALNK